MMKGEKKRKKTKNKRVIPPKAGKRGRGPAPVGAGNRSSPQLPLCLFTTIPKTAQRAFIGGYNLRKPLGSTLYRNIDWINLNGNIEAK